MRKTVLAAALILLATAVHGIEADISKNCGELDPLISLSSPNKTYGHAAGPKVFKQKVCIGEIRSSSIGTSCQRKTAFYLSGDNQTAHFSKFDTYNLHVCMGSTETRVTPEGGSCLNNETALFSVSGVHNAHIAKPSVFNRKVCADYSMPDNITLTLEANLSSSDNVYFDGKSVSGEESFTPPAELPYIVSESNSYVTGLVESSFLRAKREIDVKNRLTFTRRGNRGSFLIPFTRGDHETIKERESLILNHKLLESLKPSFGYFIPSEPLVKVILIPEQEIKSDLDVSSAYFEMKLEKIGENRVEVREVE
ncbi:MAG: hypothetical protein ABEJ83_02815 [Candidatus Nanohaloarchaea archaeon]